MTRTQIFAMINYLNNRSLEHNNSAKPDSALFDIHMTCSMMCSNISGALLEALREVRDDRAT